MVVPQNSAQRGFAILLLVSVLLAPPSSTQNLLDDEIRIYRRPYVPTTAAMRVQTDLVEVRLVVRDRNRRPVAGVAKEDIQLFDNGKPQKITTFIVGQRPAPAASTAEVAVASKPAPTDGSVAPAQPSPKAARFIALFLDDWNSPLGDLGPARTAAESFVKNSMQPGDRVGVFTASSFITVDFTNDTEKLLQAIARVVPYPNPVVENGEDFCPRISQYHAYRIFVLRDRDALQVAIEEGIAEGCLRSQNRAGLPNPIAEGMVQSKAKRIWERVEIAAQNTFVAIEDSVRRMAVLNGQRTLLLTSSGFLSLTPEVHRQGDKLIERALRSGVVINSLDAKGLVAEWLGGPPSTPRPWRLRVSGALASTLRSIEYGQREAVNDPLVAVALGTGGRIFTNNNDLAAGMRELAAAPQISYLLGFSPEKLKLDGKFHKLEVKLAGRFANGFSVDARRGYFAPTAADAEVAARSGKFESAVLATNSLAQIPCEIFVASKRPASPTAAGSGPGEPLLRVIIRVDVRPLPFQKRGDRHVEQLRVVTALFDTAGNLVTASEARVDLALRKESLERFRGQGLEGEMELAAPPGNYRLRQLVQELNQGGITAMNRDVAIH